MRTFLMACGGAAVGAGVALLFSPAGRSARELIRDKTVKCTHDAQEFVQTKSQRLASKAKSYEQQVEELVAQGQELVTHGKEVWSQVDEVLSQGKGIVEQGKQAVEKAKTAVAHHMTPDSPPVGV